MLSTQEFILIAIVAVAVVFIVADLLRADLVAILVLAILPLTGMITFQNVLMMGPGSYTSRDFLGVGTGMILVTFSMLLVGMKLLWAI